MRENVTLHAVIRLDRFLTDADAAEQSKAVTVVALLPTRKEAEGLVRLMQLRNDDNLSYYFCTPARYYPVGDGPQY